MKVLNKPLILSMLACLLLTLGGGMGWWLAMRNSQPLVDHAEATPPDSPRKVLYWYDPMMPQQHFDQPGKSPFMDMELIAKYADTPTDTGETTATELSIDPVVSASIGIRLATVSRLPLSRQIEVSGLLAFNERDVAVVQTRSGGFVERVWPLAAGDVVKAGQPLVEILAPEWAAAQQELLAVRGLADPVLLSAARERLRLLGMPDSLIRQLERTGTVQLRHTISAPIAGAIQALEVRNGMTLMSGQTLARINGLSSVWLDVAVPEAQVDAARIGNRAEVKLGGFPEQAIDARVSTILPALNESSRSIRVRIELKNPRLQLRPGQSAQVRLSSAGRETALTVPTEALIRTGKRTLVMLAGEHGRFSPLEVSVGHEIGDRTQIVGGLEEGQQVVSSGQFLIDSEASLNGIEARSLVSEHSHGTDGAP